VHFQKLSGPSRVGQVTITFSPHYHKSAGEQLDEQIAWQEAAVREFTTHSQTVSRCAQTLQALIVAKKPWFDVSDYLDWLREQQIRQALPMMRCGALRYEAWSAPAGCSD
jgi:hypothetical protein